MAAKLVAPTVELQTKQAEASRKFISGLLSTEAV
jgi:hypothetical protein